jgi:hypothetical protein
MKLITAPAAALALAALAGCTPPVRECTTTPVVVDAPVAVRAPIPGDLTAKPDQRMCAVEAPIVGGIRRQRVEACAELAKCAAQLEAIKATQGD